MKILALDSSAVTASVAVLDHTKVIAELYSHSGLTHSETLMPMVDTALRMAGCPADTLDLLAVTQGPGSFTGLRIGIACVKGMAAGLQKPCMGISTLLCIARAYSGGEGIVCACMDARCGQVYYALFRAFTGGIERLTPDSADAIEALLPQLQAWSAPVYFVGDGAALCYEALGERLTDARLAPPNLRYLRAANVALAAYESYDPGEDYAPGRLQPLYLRLPQAERELKKRKTEEGKGAKV